MWSDWLVFCDYGFSVSALWCPLTTPTILLGFLLPWTWGITLWLLQQSAAAAPYLGRGVSPHSRPSCPWTWSSSSLGFCARYSCCSLDVGLLLSVAAPYLGHGVAPLGALGMHKSDSYVYIYIYIYMNIHEYQVYINIYIHLNCFSVYMNLAHSCKSIIFQYKIKMK